MATKFTLQTGALTSEKSFTNDVKAQEILGRYADSIGATGTNKQRMDQVLEHLIYLVQLGAKEYDRAMRQSEITNAVETGNTLE